MESLTSGTLAGTGSFRCEDCGHIVTLAATEQLTSCPSCGGRSFARASLFAAGRFRAAPTAPPTTAPRSSRPPREELTRTERGPHLAFRDGDALRIVALDREWIRVGRSLRGRLRFDDATVSRRHARIAREGDEVRVLDDRSLNGVFVNGERVDSRTLRDGDELVVGRPASSSSTPACRAPRPRRPAGYAPPASSPPQAPATTTHPDEDGSAGFVPTDRAPWANLPLRDHHPPGRRRLRRIRPSRMSPPGDLPLRDHHPPGRRRLCRFVPSR